MVATVSSHYVQLVRVRKGARTAGWARRNSGCGGHGTAGCQGVGRSGATQSRVIIGDGDMCPVSREQ